MRHECFLAATLSETARAQPKLPIANTEELAKPLTPAEAPVKNILPRALVIIHTAACWATKKPQSKWSQSSFVCWGSKLLISPESLRTDCKRRGGAPNVSSGLNE